MQTTEFLILAVNAAAVGFIHTLIGADHYLPFVVIGRARGWSVRRTLAVSMACGLGHVLSSVVLGLIGVAFGITLSRLEWIESARGNLASWALIAFGAVYAAWGVRRARRGHHSHPHGHAGFTLTPWILFTVFVFGPCEPLIPVFMYPAARESLSGMIMVTAVFSAATLGTMLVMVGSGLLGLRLFHLHGLERFGHALAGLTIALAGGAIQVFGL